MNKNVLQKFAIEARRELRDKVKNKAFEYGIKEDEIKKGEFESSDSIIVNGKSLDKNQKEQRRKLIEKIETLNEQGSNGFDIVIEEVSYTWFNRLIALRFMEVNRYIKTRVLSSEEGSKIPDIVTEALDVSFRNVELDEDYIRELKLSSDINATQKLFKYMVISQCNELYNTLPFMFEKISDYTELLFPDGLLDENSFVSRMIDNEYITESDWEEVEIIGWLYQYYIAEEKDRVIKAKKKYKKEEIPFATQLFTPKWIVKYMVQNSLGRYWIESHPEDDELKKEWEFYLENPEKEPDFEEKIAPYINKELNVEDIKCFDPACGSGHILVYMFEVLYEIYSRVGYEEREIPRLIIENNLYGLDIDDRAYQLACFAVVMKGASYNKRLLRSIERDGIKLNIASIQETNNLNDVDIAYIAGERSGKNFDKVKKFVDTFYNGKTYGSLIKVDEFDKEFFEVRLEYIKDNPVDDIEFQVCKEKGVENLFENIINQFTILKNKYNILVSNPPYLASRYMKPDLHKFTRDNYNNYTDLFSIFMEKSFDYVEHNGMIGFLTPYVWMFITSYESIRSDICNYKEINSLIQLEYNAFPEACVQVCTFVLRNYNLRLGGEYIRLSDFVGSENQPIKTIEAIKNPNVDYRYKSYSSDFAKLDQSPISYWISSKCFEIMEKENSLSEFSEVKKGMNTSDNDRFLRLWSEVSMDKVGIGYKNAEDAKNSMLKWFPYNKGGGYRKWYGNNEYLINYENDGFEVKNFEKSDIRSPRLYFKDCLTWSAIGSTKPFSIRYSEVGAIFDSAGSSVFTEKEEDRIYLLGLLQSKLTNYFLKLLNPTVNYGAGSVGKVPAILKKDMYSEVNKLVIENINIAKDEWNNYESSWDFQTHPIFRFSNNSIRKSFDDWYEYTLKQKKCLKINEEELNKIFIDIYGIRDELTPDVENEDITIRLADRERDIKSFISYAVGCMLGRYSLDQEGLVYAGGEFDSSKYTTFEADEDNIIPILDESYFEDDIVNRFIEFVKVTFGEESLKENLEYIAETLDSKSGKSNPKATIRKYFLNDFYKDHVQTYKKRPIYWLVTSGKQKAFNALIYMHRYDKNTLSRIRTDYVHPLQNKLEVEKSRAEEDLSLATKASEKNSIKKKITNLDKQIDELKKFEEVLHDFADKQIEIDLDDGVVHNYGLFKGLLGKI